MKGILEEGKSILEEDFDECTMDASLIAAAQRVEHYEMAAYGSLVAWARSMQHDEAADLLQQNLEEEKAADETLSALAEGGINQSAAELAHPEMEAEADDAPKRGARKRQVDEALRPRPPPVRGGLGLFVGFCLRLDLGDLGLGPVLLERRDDGLHDLRVLHDDPDFPAAVELGRSQALAAEEHVAPVADDHPRVQAQGLHAVGLELLRALADGAEHPDVHAFLHALLEDPHHGAVVDLRVVNPQRLLRALQELGQPLARVVRADDQHLRRPGRTPAA